MRNDFTYVGFVLDRSGSMGEAGGKWTNITTQTVTNSSGGSRIVYNDQLPALRSKIDEARDNFNSMLDEYRNLEGKVHVHLTKFDNEIEYMYSGNVKDCPKLTKENFFPRDMTSLYDAIGKTIHHIGNRLSGMTEENRPARVVIVVITDGLENNSREFTSDRLKEIIETQKNTYNWKFMFFGADENSILDATSLGFGNTYLYNNDAIGTRSAYNTASSVVSHYHSTGNFDSSIGEDVKENNS